jgi:hypothetical protein
LHPLRPIVNEKDATEIDRAQSADRAMLSSQSNRGEEFAGVLLLGVQQGSAVHHREQIVVIWLLGISKTFFMTRPAAPESQ